MPHPQSEPLRVCARMIHNNMPAFDVELLKSTLIAGADALDLEHERHQRSAAHGGVIRTSVTEDLAARRADPMRTGPLTYGRIIDAVKTGREYDLQLASIMRGRAAEVSDPVASLLNWAAEYLAPTGPLSGVHLNTLRAVLEGQDVMTWPQVAGCVGLLTTDASPTVPDGLRRAVQAMETVKAGEWTWDTAAGCWRSPKHRLFPHMSGRQVRNHLRALEAACEAVKLQPTYRMMDESPDSLTAELIRTDGHVLTEVVVNTLPGDALDAEACVRIDWTHVAAMLRPRGYRVLKGGDGVWVWAHVSKDGVFRFPTERDAWAGAFEHFWEALRKTPDAPAAREDGGTLVRWQHVGDLIGCPPGADIEAYLSTARAALTLAAPTGKTATRHPNVRPVSAAAKDQALRDLDDLERSLRPTVPADAVDKVAALIAAWGDDEERPAELPLNVLRPLLHYARLGLAASISAEARRMVAGWDLEAPPPVSPGRVTALLEEDYGPLPDTDAAALPVTEIQALAGMARAFWRFTHGELNIELARVQERLRDLTAAGVFVHGRLEPHQDGSWVAGPYDDPVDVVLFRNALDRLGGLLKGS